MSESIGTLEKPHKGGTRGDKATTFPFLFLPFHKILPEVPKQCWPLVNQSLSCLPAYLPHKTMITIDANCSTTNHHPHIPST